MTATGIEDQARDPAVTGDARTVYGTAAPDLSVYHFGRGDVQRPARDTHVTFQLTGLHAWRTGDSLQIVAPNAGMTLAGPENDFAAYPAAGATAITGQTLNWTSALAPIVDAAKGDTTWVTQMVDAVSGTAHYRALAQAGIAKGFAITDGAPATLTAALAPVAQDRTLALHWRGAQFAALAAQAGPGAQPGATAAIAISTLPEPLAHTNNFFTSHYMGLPNLVELGPISGSADVDQTVNYGNPFTTAANAWSEFVTVIYSMSVPVPTKNGIGSLPARIVAALPVTALAKSGELAPPLSPVRAAKVNGQSLDTVRTSVGDAPTISWTAPAAGTATDYAVVVHAVDAAPGGVSLTTVATLHTRATSLQLPASVMVPGRSYVLTITAIAAPGADLAARPLVGSLPFASADYVTAQIAP
ncbi:MAG TPA: hypothetical protein VH165_18270 [Kofleriaceae bacterium]|nr:hypothetical protein [Kofleriaceae bacterium]